MPLSQLYAITDDSLLPGERLFEAVQQALTGGIKLLQYRSKSSEPSHKLHCAKKLQALCAKFSVPLIINDDVALCLEIGAAGVHLGQQDQNIIQARELLGPQAIIGVTCHNSLNKAKLAQQQGANYVAFGRFFASKTKPNAAAADLSILKQAKAELTIPVVAIGGINADNCASVIAAGADMVAVINYLFAGDDIRSRAQQLSKLFVSH